MDIYTVMSVHTTEWFDNEDAARHNARRWSRSVNGEFTVYASIGKARRKVIAIYQHGFVKDLAAAA